MGDLSAIAESVLPTIPVDLTNGKEEEIDLFGKAKVKRYEKDTQLRNILAILFTITINAWLIGVFFILMKNSKSLKLSDSIIITLLTTTTIQVLGMMVIILWDLFPGGKEKKNQS